MGKINLIKTLKIVLGCLSALFLAETLSLTYSTSVVIITLLSIQNTKKDTLSVAGKRFLAFFLALGLAALTFQLFQYSIFGLGSYLILFVTLCQWFKLTDGLSMSTVLMLHLWNARDFSIPSCINEFALMAIGITMGIFMNLYMPDKTKEISKDQHRIEQSIKKILLMFSLKLADPSKDIPIQKHLEQLDTLLSYSLKNAQYTEKNFLTKDMSYYASYMKMRIMQFETLERIYNSLLKIDTIFSQSILVADFMEVISLSIHEYNNAEDLLEQLTKLRQIFKSASLPQSRYEFETRAMLFEIFSELQYLLLLKKDFAASLTPYQINTFWK